jgi:5-methylcytosine-specific restriction protein A
MNVILVTGTATSDDAPRRQLSPIRRTLCHAAGVATFILTWNGSVEGYSPDDYADDVAVTAAGGTASRSWSVNRTLDLQADDRVFLLRQHTDRGIVASGRLATGRILTGPHWADPSKEARYVDVEWERVVPVADRFDFSELAVAVPGHLWNTILASGQEIRPANAAALEEAWAAHLANLAVDQPVWTLPVGETLGRRARMRRYGGSMYGGIQPSSTTPNLFLYSDPTAGTAYGYNYDGWSADGSVFLYTGEGRKGPQRLRAGNAAIVDHHRDGRTIRMFVADGTEPGSSAKIQRYIGEFEISTDPPYVTAEAPDEDGNPRTVLVFRLIPVDNVLRRPEDASASGDAASSPHAVPAAVDAAVPAPGSCDAVPIEAAATASYPVAGSASTTATRWESELVARFRAWAETTGVTLVRYRIRPPGELRDLYTDLFDQTNNVLYEAKGIATREAVRMAIGQLLDYSRHIPTKPDLAVLLPTQPAQDLLDLLTTLNITCVYETAPGSFHTSGPPSAIA